MASVASSAQSPGTLKYIAQESIFVAAIPLAFLLQIAHPGVAQFISNSDPVVQPLDRLRFTMMYLRAISCGADERARFIALLNCKQSTLAENHPTSPQLQSWIAASAFVAVVKVQETFCRGFTKPAEGELYTETSRLARSLGAPTASWPDTVDGFWEFWDDQIDILPVTGESKTLASQVLYPENVPFWALWVLLPLVRAWLIYWVPARQRKAFGLRVTLLNRAAYRLSVAVVAALYPFLPLFIRHYAHDHRWHGRGIRYAGSGKSKVERSFMVRHDE